MDMKGPDDIKCWVNVLFFLLFHLRIMDKPLLRRSKVLFTQWQIRSIPTACIDKQSDNILFVNNNWLLIWFFLFVMPIHMISTYPHSNPVKQVEQVTLLISLNW